MTLTTFISPCSRIRAAVSLSDSMRVQARAGSRRRATGAHTRPLRPTAPSGFGGATSACRCSASSRASIGVVRRLQRDELLRKVHALGRRHRRRTGASRPRILQRAAEHQFVSSSIRFLTNWIRGMLLGVLHRRSSSDDSSWAKLRSAVRSSSGEHIRRAGGARPASDRRASPAERPDASAAIFRLLTPRPVRPRAIASRSAAARDWSGRRTAAVGGRRTTCNACSLTFIVRLMSV